jgi:SAM-dependent methyltransferase
MNEAQTVSSSSAASATHGSKLRYGDNAQLDVGCGRAKLAGAIGLDHEPFDGVDVVFDLDSHAPWPFPDDTFSYVQARHVVEHVRDTLHFFAEAHRVAKDGATLYLVTPHYSSRDSWIDPTHVKHFSLFFTSQIVDGTYLPKSRYELVSHYLSFGSAIKTIPQRLWVKIFGYESYERFVAWRWPARNIEIELKVVKRR